MLLFILSVGKVSPITPVEAKIISFGLTTSLTPPGAWANFNVNCFDSDLDNSFKP